MMKLMFPGFPWHAADSGDMDLTGYRKPQSYYRDILWNGGDRVFATVRLPEPEAKKIAAIGWSVYPTLQSWTWPGREGKDMQVEVYASSEKVPPYDVFELFLDGLSDGNPFRDVRGASVFRRSRRLVL